MKTWFLGGIDEIGPEKYVGDGHEQTSAFGTG